MDFNTDLEKFAQEIDKQNMFDDQQSVDDPEAASKLLNYLVSIEGIYSPDPNYFS